MMDVGEAGGFGTRPYGIGKETESVKAMVFRGGGPGEVVTLPGEYPLSEIGELLGGEVSDELRQISSRLALIVRGDQDEGEYIVRTGPGLATVTVGDCAVVRRMRGGDRIRDLAGSDEDDARRYVCRKEDVEW